MMEDPKMPTEFTPLHERFEELTERITAPGPIDIGRALAQGRRTRVQRRARSTAVAATGIAAATALTLTAVSLHTPASPAPSSVSTLNTVTGTATDPIAVDLSFGWLPAGMSGDGVAEEPGANGTAVLHLTAETGTADSGLLELGDAPAGPKPKLSMDVTPPTALVVTSGPAINGRDSFIESLPGAGPGGPYYVVWQFGDGKWATLYVQGPSNGSISEAEAVHVARTVAQKPFPVPQDFEIDGPLAATDIVAATVNTKVGTELTMRAAGAEIQITVGTGKSNATQTCEGASDLPMTACVSVRGQLPPPLAAAGIKGILSDITLLEIPTVDVIR